MSKFFDQRKIDELSKKLAEAIPENYQIIKSDLEENFKSLLNTGLSKMDLVTREEFDLQVSVLARTRKKLEDLEQAISEANKKNSGNIQDQ
ncbi:MAG: accessory factor UbiK family protein [Pseudomonadota bacterium]|nr:hypothetical protein [Gammaproteobacteria bacterium]MEE2684238.1 accessory factor UbiK family protein [Pseudomonadota bacterium]|tara:strand:+ start:698 stop:970 length:273 start_codon:yes stop_codon:yes gene_type:complete